MGGKAAAVQQAALRCELMALPAAQAAAAVWHCCEHDKPSG